MISTGAIPTINVPKQTVVSVDLGQSTGIIVLKDQPLRLVSHQTIPLDSALAVICSADPTIVILEEMPITMSVENLVAAYLKIKGIMAASRVSLFTVQPGNWKPLAKANKWDFSTKSSEHEKDAYNMMRWFIRKNMHFDIGDLSEENAEKTEG